MRCKKCGYSKKCCMCHRGTGTAQVSNSRLIDGLNAALAEVFEEVPAQYVARGDVGFEGQHLVDGTWYMPRFGCDSLQMFIDRLKGM